MMNNLQADIAIFFVIFLQYHEFCYIIEQNNQKSSAFSIFAQPLRNHKIAENAKHYAITTCAQRAIAKLIIS